MRNGAAPAAACANQASQRESDKKAGMNAIKSERASPAGSRPTGGAVGL